MSSEKQLDLPHSGKAFDAEFEDYLRDESRRVGRAESISFPWDEDGICDVLHWASQHGVTVTTQGARTGITGGSTPEGGHVLNLSRMKRMKALRRCSERDGLIVTVEPGVLLAEVNALVAGEAVDIESWSAESLAVLEQLRAARPGYLFAPDLTETSASVGGLVSCNGSGARSYLYGPARNHVHRLRMVLADGDVLVLDRETTRAHGREFTVVTEGGRTICGQLPAYRVPDVKNAAGYTVSDDISMLELFVGSEGTLGVFSEIELYLVPAPAALWGITVFLPQESAALELVQRARAETCATAIEFMDFHALNLLRRQKAENPAFSFLPELPENWHTGVYVEYQGRNEDDLENQVAMLSGIMEDVGGNPDATWLAGSPREIEQFKRVRHAIPESVNLLIDERRKQEPGLTKLGTDLSVPNDRLADVIAMYRAGLDSMGFESVTFGHISNNHVHVNIIPRTMQDYERGKALYLDWAQKVTAMGGSVSAEHGIGKLKTRMLEIMYGADGIAQMRCLKRTFDPHGLLNRGNLFEWQD
ncbi:MAG: FAD-binding oxidoreductase [Kiritimatiellae bacterium]|nr:FAD-binding oxidoreductase [Kiritimatiellia bacterium]